MQSLTLESATEERRSRKEDAASSCEGVHRWLDRLAVYPGRHISVPCSPRDPNKQELTAMMKEPQGIGAPHALGTDNLDRDILSW